MIRTTRTAFVAALALLALQPAFAEPSASVQTRCFQFADQPDRLLQLRFVDTEDGNSAAFVRYGGAKGWIPLVLSRDKHVPMADSGRSEADSQWLEIVQDRVGGRYAVRMLGNEMISFDYTNAKTGKKTGFTLAPTPRGVDPCEAK